MKYSSRRGFFILEIVGALFIVALLASAMAVALVGRSRAATIFAGDRAAVRAADRALVDLRLGLPTTDGTIVRDVARVAPPADGTRWVEVTATVNGRTATLVGAVPVAATKGAMP